MASIDILEGYHQGKRHTIEGATTLGRAPNNTLCLHDPRASRQHALIRSTPDGDGYLICDLGSGNGTLVNGERIDVGVPHPLADGDNIRIGTTVLGFRGDGALAEEEEQNSRKPIPNTTIMTKDQAELTVMVDPAQSAAVTCTMDASRDMLETQEMEDHVHTIKRLRAMAQLAAELAEIVDKEMLLDRVMDKIFQILPQADRACIMMRKFKGGDMVPMIGRNRTSSSEGRSFAISTTVMEDVIENRHSVLSSNAQDEFSEQQSIVDLSIRSMMCVPLICHDNILGVINVDSVSSNDAFNEDDLKLLTGLAAQAATALRNVALFDQVDSKNESSSQLSRYVPPDLAKGIVDGRVTAELEGKRTRGAVVHALIEGFNEMSDELDAKALIDHVNHSLKITADIIARNNGALNRFGHDMVIANWNVLLPDDAPELHAITAAIQMQAATWHFDLDLNNANVRRVHMRIGVNTGDLTGGNIGGERFEYNVVGHTLDLAERMRELARHWQVLVTDNTFGKAADLCTAIRFAPVQIPGEKEPVTLFSVRGVKGSDGRMTFNIPVRVLDSSDAILGEGLITGGKGDGEAGQVFLASMPVITPGKKVRLHFDVPECPQTMELAGTIEDETRATYYGEVAFSKSTLGKLSAEPHVFEFLTPGSLVESAQALEW